MGKYEPLADFLRGFKEDSWEASFSDIERILGFTLPPSAREHRAWWANQYRGHHSQAKAWVDSGWATREIDLRKGRVRFERTRSGGRRDRGLEDHDRWLEAERITGITDRAELERAAIAALLEREASRILARMGGSMQSAAAAPRERPFQ
jgi:hypothetical protein